MKILVVDDEPLALEGMCGAVRRVMAEEAEIQKAENGAQALDLCKTFLPDVAFLDVEMPGITGLELVKEMKNLSPHTETIMVTAYPEYSIPALKLHVSDYLLKPVEEQEVREALHNLRHSDGAQKEQEKILVQCFGNFEVFYRGQHISFKRSRAKEMLAYLIGRRGAGVTAGELCAVLWEEDNNPNLYKTYLRQYYSVLRKTFEELGFEGLVQHDKDVYYVDVQRLSCDYYAYLDGEPETRGTYRGEFMNQYSWGEIFHGTIQSV